MKIRISSCLNYLFIPVLFLTVLLPVSGGSLFDFTVLPILILYSLSRFIQVVSSLSIKLPVFCYTGVLLMAFFVRFIVSNDTDFVIAGTGLRLLMPISALVLFVDLFRYMGKLDSSRKASLVESLMTSYLLLMIGIMIWSFCNGIGPLGLGLSFPLYTETHSDRHVYGPAVAALVVFCIFLLSSGRKNIITKRLYPLILTAAIIGVFSSIASGSRSPFAMYSVAVVYALTTQMLRSRYVPILKIIGFSLLVLFGVMVLKELNIGVFRNGANYSSLINRALGFFQAVLHPASDHSRGGVYSLTIIDKFSSIDNWLLGAPNASAGGADHGPLNLFLNGGIPLLFSFLAVWFSVLFILPFSGLKIFLVAVLGQFLMASETLFIPRYFLIVSFQSFLLALYTLPTSISATIAQSSTSSFHNHREV